MEQTCQGVGRSIFDPMRKLFTLREPRQLATRNTVNIATKAGDVTIGIGPHETTAKQGPIAHLQAGTDKLENGRARKQGVRINSGKLVWSGPENDIPMTRGFLIELVLWMPYLAAVFWMRTIRAFDTAAPPHISFWPSSPGPWYMIVGAAAWGGVRIDTSSTAIRQVCILTM